jgi:subtilisin-like proprotein convertase family protein
LLSVVALAFFGAAAFGQSEPAPFVARGPLHRIVIAPDNPLLSDLFSRNALASVEDYGSFTFAVVDASRAGGLAALLERGAQLADEQTLVELNGYTLDGADARTTSATVQSIPNELRGDAGGDRHLRLIQFNGPIRGEWVSELEATGAFVVTYIASNAYVVATDAASDAALSKLAQRKEVLALSNYEPAFKLRSELRPPAIGDSAFYDVTVQVIADAQGEGFAQAVVGRAVAVLQEPNRVLDYINVGVRIDGANVLDLARDGHVFAIEPIYPARKFDEAQGQIMASNLNGAGTQPTGPGYIAWLQSKGFPGANPFPFVVDVTDDGIDRGSTSDVNVEFKVDGLSGGASRVSYINNYSGDALGDSQDGHGNINASIISGYNSGTGSAFEDASGFNYGLGIAPWAKVGDSKVFANGGAGVFNQPTLTRMGNAYAGGARISSNSWGYTSGSNYNADTQAHDQAVRDSQSGTAGNQELAIVFAAGNSGSGASTVHPPGTGKNILCVGASENFRQTGSDGCGIANSGADSALDIISFSGRGPTSDSRKKPDIMAPGTHIEGAASRATGYNGSGVCNQFWPTGQTLYAWSSGTSHSTPAVSGACALLRQYFANNGFPAPSPAMLKAYLCNSVTYMTGVGANDTLPSNNQGMGRINLGLAFDSAARVRVDQTTTLANTGDTFTSSGTISSSASPFRVSLAWTDAPGATTGNAFVNNLDLEVTVNGTLYRGNVFSGASSISGGTADIRNNMECVFLPAGTTGSFSVVVRATNIAGDGVPGNGDTTDQDFALVVYNGSTSAPAPDFTLSATPSSQSVVAGNGTSFNVSNGILNGFSGNVTLSVSPAISGVSYSFTPNPMAAGGSSTLNVTTTSGATLGSQLLTITGTSGALVHTANVTLNITAAPVPDFSISGSPPSATITAGGSTNYSVSSSAFNGFGGSISLSASPAISGVTYSFSPNPIAAGGGSTLNVTTTTGATTGTQNITITGTSGSLVHSTNVSLTINPVAGGNTVKTYSVSPGLSIPDNNATGVTSTINVPISQTVSSVSVGTTIPHTYKGDLVVTLIAPDGTNVLLHNRTGGSTDNVTTTFAILTAPAQSLTALNGKNTSGNWSLKVQDLAAVDVGTLSSWNITFNGEQSASPALAIPDNNATGVTSTLNYSAGGTVAGIKVSVNITHTYKGDLEVALIAPDNTIVLLHNLSGGATDNVITEFPDLTAPAQSLAALTGKSINGAWRLRVRDLAAADVGTLNSWTLSIAGQ